MADQIKCRCPQCGTHYRVPASVEGHRARCRTCGRVFSVAGKTSGPPTEDDILRWLQEAEERDDTTRDEWPESRFCLCAIAPDRPSDQNHEATATTAVAVPAPDREQAEKRNFSTSRTTSA